MTIAVTSTIKKDTMLRLAVADFRHEWVLNLCMILALGAVIAPLLLLMGLKYGTISTLRDRLVEDPVNREIKPQETRDYRQTWFDGIKDHPDLGDRLLFLVPSILRGHSSLSIEHPESSMKHSVDLIPTAAGDPLLLENNVDVPGPGEVVLSSSAANRLELERGNDVVLHVTRNMGAREEAVTEDARVIGVLPAYADPLESVYTVSEFTYDVERYRFGKAIPSRDWPGGLAVPHATFDSVILMLPTELDGIERFELSVGSGINLVEEVDATAFADTLGFSLNDGFFAYRLTASGTAIDQAVLDSIGNRMRGKDAMIVPHVEGMTLSIDGQSVDVIGLSLSDEDAERLGLALHLPWGRFDPERNGNERRQIVVSGDWPETTQGRFDAIGETFSLTTYRMPETDLTKAIIPAMLAGVLRTAADESVQFSQDSQDFERDRVEFHGFRMYVRSIDDVQTAYDVLTDQGIEVSTKLAAISRVKELDRSLTNIFWLVAIVGITGGVAALIASLYAAVERKKREFGLLRLIGIRRFSLCRFPIYQAVTIAFFASIVAILAYSCLSLVINRVFAEDLELGERICRIPPSYFLYTIVLTSIVGCASSISAARRATEIEPADAIREE